MTSSTRSVSGNGTYDEPARTVAVQVFGEQLAPSRPAIGEAFRTALARDGLKVVIEP